MCCRLKISSCCCGLRALGPGVHSLGVAALLINLAMLLAPGWLGLPMVDQSGYEARTRLISLKTYFKLDIDFLKLKSGFNTVRLWF